MKIFEVTDKEFLDYGRVIDIDTTQIIKEASKITLPDEGSSYLPLVDAFQELDIKKYFENEVFGELPVQVGYCYGHSNYLNALEWHKSSEVNVAVTDLVLILGKFDELVDGKYDSSKCKAFKVKKGQCIEVYPLVLHFCPCEVQKEGFGCVVVLPEGTNLVMDNKPEDSVLFKKNKWIICHVDNTSLIERGVVARIYGENFKIEY